MASKSITPYLIYFVVDTFDNHTRIKCNLFKSLEDFWNKIEKCHYRRVVIESIVER